jgi:hypothetical protein
MNAGVNFKIMQMEVVLEEPYYSSSDGRMGGRLLNDDSLTAAVIWHRMLLIYACIRYN